MPFFFTSAFWRELRFAALLLLLLGGLVVQRSCDGPTVPPPFSAAAPAHWPEPVAIVPASLLMPHPAGVWVRLLDSTHRAGSRSHLARKAAPRSRWLPAQPAYFSHLHRRPPQSYLDSLARAASFRRI